MLLTQQDGDLVVHAGGDHVDLSIFVDIADGETIGTRSDRENVSFRRHPRGRSEQHLDVARKRRCSTVYDAQDDILAAIAVDVRNLSAKRFSERSDGCPG